MVVDGVEDLWITFFFSFLCLCLDVIARMRRLISEDGMKKKSEKKRGYDEHPSYSSLILTGISSAFYPFSILPSELDWTNNKVTMVTFSDAR